MTILLVAPFAADHANQQRGSWVFHWSIICLHRKRIAVAIDKMRRLSLWSGGSRFDKPQPQKGHGRQPDGDGPWAGGGPGPGQAHRTVGEWPTPSGEQEVHSGYFVSDIGGRKTR